MAAIKFIVVLALLFALTHPALAQTSCGANCFNGGYGANGGIGGTAANQPGSDRQISAINYGAQGRGAILTNAAMTSSAGTTFTCSGTCFPTGFILSFRGVNNVTPVDVSGNTTGTSGTPAAPAVTTTAANDTLISAIGLQGTFTPQAPPPTTKVNINYSPTNFYGLYGATQTIASPGLTSAVTGTASSAAWVGLSVALQPAGATAISQVGNPVSKHNAAGSSLVLFNPSEWKPGDVELACLAIYGNNITVTTPSGWTLVTSGLVSGASGVQALCYDRVLAPNNGSTLTATGAGFASSLVGDRVCMAGIASATVTDHVSTRNQEGCGFILSVTDASDIVVSTSNQTGSNVTAQVAIYATDDDAGMQAAVAAACGKILVIPAGIYGLQTTLAPCTTGGTRILGAGGSLVEYQGTGTLHNGAAGSGTVLDWMSTSMTGPGILLGTGITTVLQSNAIYSWYDTIEDLGVIGGIGFMYDGGGATSDGIKALGISHYILHNVYTEGWGGNGHNGQGNGGFIAVVDMIGGVYTMNGANGVKFGGEVQNVYMRGVDSSVNWLDGVLLPGVVGSGGYPETLVNNILQWNNQSGTNPGYELAAVGAVPSGSSVIGTWFEETFAGSNTTPFDNATAHLLGFGQSLRNNFFQSGPERLLFSAAGVAIPAASTNNELIDACVTDSTACTNGTTYTSGGSTPCDLESNGTNWIETGSGIGCY